MDLDGDGKNDILSGSWPGELYFFRGEGNGKFAKGETLNDADGKPIKLGSASTVFAADWNGDGKLDLLIGDQQGNVHLMLNEGTARAYAFKKSTKLECEGKAISVSDRHGDSHPIVVDWDGDKKLDLIVAAGDGSVLFFKNTGEKEPKLAAAETLVPKTPSEFGKQTEGCGMRSKVCVFDWNGDGKPDLLVGDMCYTVHDKAKMTEEDKKAIEEAKKKLPDAEKAQQEISTEWQALFNPPRKKETAEEKAAREEKLKAAQTKLQEMAKEIQEPQKRYGELFQLERQGKATDEQKKELKELAQKVQDWSKKYTEFYQKEVMPVAQPPADETPQQQKVREEKLKVAQEKMQKLSSQLYELQSIINKYEQPQLGGAVWLFVRK